MERGSPSNYPSRLEISNHERGDVAVCGSLPTGGSEFPDFEDDRVCFVAPLNSRSDVEWILRGLHSHPTVRHLIVCGDDHRSSAEALISVLKDGLGESGSLRHSRGILSSDLTAPAVDVLRADIEVWDWRDKPMGDVAEGIALLPTASAQRKTEPLPYPVIPTRKVFLSRKTSFPVFSSDVGDSWLQLLNLVLKIGAEKKAADGERFAEALNTIVTVGLPVVAEDLEVDEVPERREHATYLEFNPDDFERYFGRLIASRLDALDGVDQFESIWAQLKEFPDTQASTMVLPTPGESGHAQGAPGSISCTFDVTDGALYGSFAFRRADVYSEWPLEAMALTRLHRLLAQKLDLDVGASTFVIHSARLSERDWERSGELLKEHFRRPLPLQVDHSGVFLFGNDGGRARGMLLDHDASTIFWEDAFENPQELSWYIVDSMPWLLPQHIRYVGQEYATLSQAMQKSECYLQG